MRRAADTDSVRVTNEEESIAETGNRAGNNANTKNQTEKRAITPVCVTKLALIASQYKCMFDAHIEQCNEELNLGYLNLMQSQNFLSSSSILTAQVHFAQAKAELLTRMKILLTQLECKSSELITSLKVEYLNEMECHLCEYELEMKRSEGSSQNVPPHWDIEPQDTFAVSGQNILIECSAEGFPAPVITWERVSSANSPRHYCAIASGPHYQVYANGSLLIKNTQEVDAGYYVCKAGNGIGAQISKVVFLTVLDDHNSSASSLQTVKNFLKSSIISRASSISAYLIDTATKFPNRHAIRKRPLISTDEEASESPPLKHLKRDIRIGSIPDPSNLMDNSVASDGTLGHEIYSAWTLLSDYASDAPSQPGVYQLKVCSSKRPAFISACFNLNQRLTMHCLCESCGNERLTGFIRRNMPNILFRYEAFSSATEALKEEDERLHAFQERFKARPAYN